MNISDFLWLVLLLVLLPLTSFWVTEKAFPLPKTKGKKKAAAGQKRQQLYAASIISALVSYPLSMIFLPLSYLGMPVVMFLALSQIAKMSPGRSMLAAVFFSLLYLVVFSVVAIVLMGFLGFS